MEEVEKSTEIKKYKLRELKVYSSTEWLADNKKKYRQVFDRYDTTFIYAELSFYNKMFDRDFFEMDIELKCFTIAKSKKEICNLSFKRRISKYDPIVFIREGWGNKKEGSFWKKGTYFWEAWIDGEKVATKYFYIEDAGSPFSPISNPYIELKSIKLYEGPFDDVIEVDRMYLKKFSGEETRYIYAEVYLKNINPASTWQCEIATKFYNEARELKGQVVRLVNVKKEEEYISFTAGWGTNVKGSWWYGQYTVEVVFMDQLMGVMAFEVSDESEDGVSHITSPYNTKPLIIPTVDEGKESLNELLVGLDRMIGLTEIKQKVRDHAKYIQFLKLRKEKGIAEHDEMHVHAVFYGNPGTGKTTVAKMMGKLYRKMGVLSKGHIMEADRSDLVGEYIGQTAPKVKEIIEKARGGVLFIDEAYALARTNDDSKDFGREVIEMLVKEMSNGQGDLAVIVAGYPKEMKHFLDSNPGLKSRFKLFYEFPDYYPDELYQIIELACQDKAVDLTEDARQRLHEMILNAYRKRDQSFGNARYVIDLLEKAKVNLGVRVMSKDSKDLSAEELRLITVEDVETLDELKIKRKPSIPIDEKLLQEALLELNSLIGIEPVKKEITELIKIVRYYRESGKEVLHNFYFHTIFLGNPGTGKSTVARILAKMFKALGMLERGHLVETDRQGLVAGFVGQSAIKTAEKIEEAQGGVLFIDEAYSLTAQGGIQGDYGQEVIQTLIKRMEDKRGEFFVFVAGYTDNMETFMKSNPGLSSRFDRVLKFEDYNTEELMSIAEYMFSTYKAHLHPEAKEQLYHYLQDLYGQKDKYFGNARTVRLIVQEVMRNQNLRFSNLPEQDRSHFDANQIISQDIQNISAGKLKQAFNRKSLGYGRN